MYARDDIRSSLAPAPARTNDPNAPVKPAQTIEFRTLPPTERGARGGSTWIARAANLVISYSDALAGEVFDRDDQPDEYTLVLFSESAPLRITAGDDTVEVAEEALVVVPPGPSRVEVLADGPVIRLFSTRAADLVDAALNADAYREPDLHAAPLEPWPDPVGGFALRVYPLAATPIVPGTFGRILRTTTVMVNFLAEEPAPRDPHALSPHFHDDFEQISLAVKGRFRHHIRYPWVPDLAQWRDDEHLDVGSPSICIIPPPTIHTTQGLGPHQQLIDVFAPPREDFSAAGWVRNADEYPAR